MSARPVILVVAPEPSGSHIAKSLAEPGQEILAARSVAEAEGLLARVALDVVVAELETSGRDALGLLHVLPDRAPDLPLVALAARSESPAAAEALRLGAFDVVEREDAAPAALKAAIARAAEHHDLRREVSRLRRDAATRDRAPLLGRSDAMRQAGRQVDEAAAREAPVLLIGPAGTGKAHVAREIHSRSPRANGPFVMTSCEAIHPAMLESQLFGHRRGGLPGAVHDHDGAFRSASGGTLFLDRFELLPLPLQVKLVEALRSGKATPVGAPAPVDIDARLVASCSREIEPLVRAGKFREDLAQLLGATTLRLAALKDRREDIPFLAEAFGAEEAERFGVAPRRFDADAVAVLTAHAWPGNVRELRQAVREAFARGLGETIRTEHLPPSVRAGARAALDRDPDRLPTLAESEAELVALVLEDSRGNKTLAARRLGIDRKRLYRKIKRYGLLGADSGGPDAEDDEDDAEG